MNTEALDEILSFYKKNYDVITDNENYKWEAGRIFHTCGLLDGLADDTTYFLTRLNEFLTEMDNLLNGNMHFQGKEALIKCAKTNPVKVRKALLDLNYSEYSDKSLMQRMDEFDASMLEIADDAKLSEVQKATFSENYRAASMFLYYMFPQKYYIYKFKESDYVRKTIGFDSFGDDPREKVLNAYKMYDEILEYIKTDEELMELHKARQGQYCEYDPEYHLLVQNIIWSTNYDQKGCDKLAKASYANVKEAKNPKDITAMFLIDTTRETTKRDYIEDQRRSKSIGDSGEELVYRYEYEKCCRLFPNDESKRPEHISKRTDSKGYDVVSFDEKGNKIYIEVKTTSGSYETEFYFTEFELEISKIYDRQYFLYRVYNFSQGKGDIKITRGSLEKFAKHPASYRVSLKD